MRCPHERHTPTTCIFYSAGTRRHNFELLPTYFLYLGVHAVNRLARYEGTTEGKQHRLCVSCALILSRPVTSVNYQYDDASIQARVREKGREEGSFKNRANISRKRLPAVPYDSHDTKLLWE